MERGLGVRQLGRPTAVAAAIDKFGRNAINPFLAVAGDPVGHRLTEEEFRRANLGPAKAQLALVNAIRRSLGRDEDALQVFLGGSFIRPEDWPEMALGAIRPDSNRVSNSHHQWQASTTADSA
jgi:hypothetical protein